MRTSRRIAIACALAAAGAAHVSAQSVAGGGSGSGGVVERQTARTAGGIEIDGQPVTLRASGAALQVYLGDEPYPESRMKGDGDRTILLDKAGKPAAQMVVEGRRVTLLPISGLVVGQGRLLLGVSLTSPDAVLAGHLGLEPQRASVISSVTEGWPADKAGLAVGDVIVSAGDRDSGATEDLRAVIAERKAGDTVTLGVISAGTRKRVTVTLSDEARESVAGAGLFARQLDAELLAGQYAAAEARQAAVAKALVDAERRQRDSADQAAAGAARAADLYRLQQESALLRAQEMDRRALAEYLASARSAGSPVTIQSAPSGGALRAVVPGAASAAGAGDISARLAALEARIARMEEMLQKLTEQSAGR
ncbi:MAG: PDZ domain-containing protein [Phycisphaerales bacterium JB039]